MAEKTNLLKAYYNSRLFELINGVLGLGLTIFLAWEWPLKEVERPQKVWLAIALSILGFYITSSFSYLLKLVLQRDKELDEQNNFRGEVLQNVRQNQNTLNHYHEEMLRAMGSHGAELERVQHHVKLFTDVYDHRIGSEILSEYTNKIVSHLTEHSELITLQRYLDLLNWSLDRVTEEVFATSLVGPEVFAENQAAKDYLDAQTTRAQELPHLKISRVFVCSEDDWRGGKDKGPTQDVISKHKKAGIRIGFCNKAILKTMGLAEYMDDFVYFRSDGRRHLYAAEEHKQAGYPSGGVEWVVDAGDITSAIAQENLVTAQVRVRLVLNKTILGRHWTDARKQIESHTSWVGEKKDMQNEENPKRT